MHAPFDYEAPGRPISSTTNNFGYTYNNNNGINAPNLNPKKMETDSNLIIKPKFDSPEGPLIFSDSEMKIKGPLIFGDYDIKIKLIFE
jgi:hypothetical protein